MRSGARSGLCREQAVQRRADRISENTTVLKAALKARRGPKSRNWAEKIFSEGEQDGAVGCGAGRRFLSGGGAAPFFGETEWGELGERVLWWLWGGNLHRVNFSLEKKDKHVDACFLAPEERPVNLEPDLVTHSGAFGAHRELPEHGKNRKQSRWDCPNFAEHSQQESSLF